MPLRTISKALVLTALALPGAGSAARAWPTTSTRPVAALDRPSIEVRAAAAGVNPDSGYRFAAFGDQRALANGEWQALLRRIARIDREGEPILFLLDTGDIVNDGSYTDQFGTLTELLRPVSDLPYLVSVGNHEIHGNQAAARENAAAFLRGVDPRLSASRMYYSKTIGPARILFLDSTDLLSGDHPARREAQLRWLVDELARPTVARTTIVAVHHPFLQTAAKHLDQARRLWELRRDGRTLPDILADGGVDLVLTGHVHTYETFHAERSDGKGFDLIDVSGRPLTRDRRPKRIAGREAAWFGSRGWADLDRWTITQTAVMLEEEADQFSLITVDPDGGLTPDTRFVPRGDDTTRPAAASGG